MKGVVLEARSSATCFRFHLSVSLRVEGRHVGMGGMVGKLDIDGLAVGARFLSFFFAVFFSSSNLHF